MILAADLAEFGAVLGEAGAEHDRQPWFVLWLDVVGLSWRNTELGVAEGDKWLAAVAAALPRIPDIECSSIRFSDEWLVAFLADPTLAIAQGQALLDRISDVSGVPLHGILLAGDDAVAAYSHREYRRDHTLASYERPKGSPAPHELRRAALRRALPPSV